MNQDTSEKGLEETGVVEMQTRKFKWIYLFPIVMILILMSSLILFKYYQVGPDTKPLHSSNTFDISDQDFAEFKSDTIDLTEIRKDLTSDFIGNLKEVPMRTKLPVGIVKSGESNYASTVIQVIFRFPMMRRVLANLEIYNEYHVLHMENLKKERKLIEKSNEMYKNWNLKMFDKKVELAKAAKDIAKDLSRMFSRLQSSEKSLVRLEPENLLKLNFFDNFSNFKHVGNYFTKLIEYIIDFVPESQHQHLLVEYKDTCEFEDSEEKGPFEEMFKVPRLELDLTENERNLSDLMKKKFLEPRSKLEWHGPPVNVKRESKLFSLPNMVAIQIEKISSYIDPKEVDKNDIPCGYHGPQAPEKRVDGKFKGIYTIKNQMIEMPLKFDFAPYFDRSVSDKKTKYSLKMFITFEEIDKNIVYNLIVKENDSKWYKIRDNKVEEVAVVTLNELSSGYIYFYEQDE